MNADKSMEDAFFEREAKLNMLAFEQQAQYGVFYAYVKLKARVATPIVTSCNFRRSKRFVTSSGSPSALRKVTRTR